MGTVDHTPEWKQHGKLCIDRRGGPRVKRCPRLPLYQSGMAVAVAAHNINKREAIFAETDASQHLCDASDADQVASLFAELDNTIRTPDMVVYNP